MAASSVRPPVNRSHSSSGRRVPRAATSSLTSTSPSVLLFSLLLALLAVVLISPPVSAYVNHGFNIKQRSAIQALKNLDHRYMMQNRPRFGKRFGNEVATNFYLASSSEDGDEAVDIEGTSSVPAKPSTLVSSGGSILGRRWLLLNRNKPLTRLAESYVRELLAETEKYRAQQQRIDAAVATVEDDDN